MALNLNKVVLAGRLTADVELKKTTNGMSVCSFTLAINRRYSKEGQPQTDFINCTAWAKTAEFISGYFKKGSALCIAGNIQTRNWEDGNGQKRYATDVIVDEAYFVESKNDAQGTESAGASDYYPKFGKAQDEPNFEAVGDDNFLPF